MHGSTRSAARRRARSPPLFTAPLDLALPHVPCGCATRVQYVGLHTLAIELVQCGGWTHACAEGFLWRPTLLHAHTHVHRRRRVEVRGERSCDI